MSDLVTLRDLHDAMLAALQEAYPAPLVATVTAYDPVVAPVTQEAQPLTAPALLLHLLAIDPGAEDGTDRDAARLTWALHCVLSARTADLALEVREFAADVRRFIRYQQWGYPSAVGVPEALAAQEADFAPGLAGYDSWVVTWEQSVYLGEDIWLGTGAPPQQILYSWAPRIGAAYEPEYQPLETTS